MPWQQNIYMRMVESAAPTGSEAGQAVVKFLTSDQPLPGGDPPEGPTDWSNWVSYDADNVVSDVDLGGQVGHADRYPGLELLLDPDTFTSPDERTLDRDKIYVVKAEFTPDPDTGKLVWTREDDGTDYKKYDEAFQVRPALASFTVPRQPAPWGCPGLIIGDVYQGDPNKTYSFKLWVKCPFENSTDGAQWIVDPELVIRKRSTPSAGGAAAGA